jgi:hypothetical protein
MRPMVLASIPVRPRLPHGQGDARQGVREVNEAINIPTLRASFGIDALMKLWHCSSQRPPGRAIQR